MFALKLLLATILVIGVQSRVPYHHPYYTIDDSNVLEEDDVDHEREYVDHEREYVDHEREYVHPVYLRRTTRQLHGTMNTNPDGSFNINGKLPLLGNDQNVLSAIGSGSAIKNRGSYSAATGGLALDNVNGQSLSLTKTHIPSFGDQLTAAGKVNLLNTEKHNLNANVFTTRNKPKFPGVPNFTTNGGGVDYTFNNKIGASLGASHTDFLKRTDVSAMGNLNLFRDKSSSLDFNAGASRSFSPFIPKSSWQPNVGLSFSKYF